MNDNFVALNNDLGGVVADPWVIVSGSIIYDCPPAGSSGSLTFVSSQWIPYPNDNIYLLCEVDEDSGLITARLITDPEGAGDAQFEFSLSGSGIISASGYLTSAIEEAGETIIVSSGTYSAYILASGGTSGGSSGGTSGSSSGGTSGSSSGGSSGGGTSGGSTIFDGGRLEVSFDPLKQDLATRGRDKLLVQFHSEYPTARCLQEYSRERYEDLVTSGASQEVASSIVQEELTAARDTNIKKVFNPVIAQIMNAIGMEFNEFYDAAIEVMIERTLFAATGDRLDVLGEIVGISRVEIDDLFEMDDGTYRSIIKAKIFKNHSHYASCPEIRSFIKLLLDQNFSFMKVRSLTAKIAANATDSAGILGLLRYLIHRRDNISVDWFYNLPIPPEVELETDNFLPILRNPEDNTPYCFSPDSNVGRPDYAHITVTRAL